MSQTEAPASPLPRRERWLALAIFLVAFLAYWPSLSGGFLWDDDGHVTQPQLRSLEGLVDIWTEPAATQQYYPLLHTAFWIEHKLWGEHATGYRIVNLLLHATAACLFAALLRKLSVPGAWAAAFLFALHPVCIESVAWISEQKNTLSLVFHLLAALAYLRFDEHRRPAAYLAATGFFAAALLSKTVTVTLPAALLVIFVWKRRGLAFRRDVAPLLPWFALGIAAGLMTVWNERTLIGASGGEFSLSPPERILLAGRVVWFYLCKLVWPAGLAFVYPRWTLDVAPLWQWIFPLLTVVATATLAWRKNLRTFLVPWLLFVGTLFPALGFFNVYPFVFSYVADHFQYHASLAFFALAGAALARLSARLPHPASWIPVVLAALVLGVLTFGQAKNYRSADTLWMDTLEKNPSCWLAHNNLAQILIDDDQPEFALPHLQRALELRPGFTEAENNLGFALYRLRRFREALPYFERAVAAQPKYAQAHNNLGLTWIELGELERATASFRDAIRSHPRFPLAHFNLGLALAQSGRTSEAMTEYQRALRLDPGYAPAESNWAVALAADGRFEEAFGHFEKAVALDPSSVPTRLAYGRALAQNGKWRGAVDQLTEALELDPDCIEAHKGLAATYPRLGRLQEADYHLNEALRLQQTTGLPRR